MALALAGIVAAPATAWAQDSSAPLAVPDDGLGELAPIDPDAPLSPYDDTAVDWPDPQIDPPALPELDDAALDRAEAADAAEIASQPPLPQADELPPAPALAELLEGEDDEETDLAGVAGDATGARRYSVALRGLEELDETDVERRFDALSTLRDKDEDPAQIAQINRRAEEDAELLTRLLKIDGYFDPQLTFDLVPAPGGDRLLARFVVAPGPHFTYSAIDFPGLEAAGADAAQFRAAVPLAVGDPIDQDAIVAGRTKLATAMLENGYPFSSVAEPELTVDHDTDSGALVMPTTPGGKRRFGRLIVDDGGLLGARHIGRIARFDPGDLYRASEVEDLRRALVATGLVSSVTVAPVDAGDGQNADVAVTITPAPLRTIAGELGYGTGEGFRAEASWEHRNFFPPEGMIRLRAVAGTREQLANVVFRRNNFMRRDQVLTIQGLASNSDFDAYAAKTALLSGTLERKTTLIFQKKWAWSLGAELVYTSERSAAAAPRTTYYVAALPTSLAYDGTDDLLDPQKGFRLSGRVSPEFSLASGSDGYARVQLDASAYYPVTDRVVLAGRARLGTIAGARTNDIAPSRRNYAGGGGSVRGYGYQGIGPRDAEGDPIGGRGLVELSAEARVRLGSFGVVPFVDVGNVYDSEFPDFSGLRIGAGVGVRYYTNFGPIRVDVGTPLNPRRGDPRVAVYVSLGQAF